MGAKMKLSRIIKMVKFIKMSTKVMRKIWH